MKYLKDVEISAAEASEERSSHAFVAFEDLPPMEEPKIGSGAFAFICPYHEYLYTVSVMKAKGLYIEEGVLYIDQSCNENQKQELLDWYDEQFGKRWAWFKPKIKLVDSKEMERRVRNTGVTWGYKSLEWILTTAKHIVDYLDNLPASTKNAIKTAVVLYVAIITVATVGVVAFAIHQRNVQPHKEDFRGSGHQGASYQMAAILHPKKR